MEFYKTNQTFEFTIPKSFQLQNFVEFGEHQFFDISHTNDQIKTMEQWAVEQRDHGILQN